MLNKLGEMENYLLLEIDRSSLGYWTGI